MVEEEIGNSEILTIFNRYKNILDDLINSSNPEFLDQVKLINVKTHNASNSEASLADILKDDHLDKCSR